MINKDKKGFIVLNWYHKFLVFLVYELIFFNIGSSHQMDIDT